jgi:hypothetical protein
VFAAGPPLSDEDQMSGAVAELVTVMLFELPCDDSLTFGAAEDVDLAVDLAEAVDPPETVDPAGALELEVCRGDAVVQCGVGTGPAVGVTFPVRLGLLLGLEAGLTLGLGLELAESPGLGLTVSLELGLPVSAGLVPGLVAPSLSLPLVDTAGLLVVALFCAGELALPDEPDVDGVADACAEVVGQAVAAALGRMPAMCPEESTGPLVVGAGSPFPSVDSVPDEAEVPAMVELRCTSSWRAVGTTARTIPRTNTARPVAKAGRSMASRQSRGCRAPCDPDERGPDERCPAERGPPARRARSATEPRYRSTKPEKAAQLAITPWCWLAWADRDWIFSRIRSRPSASG